MELEQMDVRTAFLDVELEEDICGILSQYIVSGPMGLNQGAGAGSLA